MALKVKMNATDLDELETEIPLFATQEESEDIQVDEQMTIKIKVKEKEEQSKKLGFCSIKL